MANLFLSSSKAENGAKGNDFTTRFQVPLSFPGGAERFEVYAVKGTAINSIFNIEAQYNNNLLAYYNGSVWNDVTYPDGSFPIQDINEYLQRIMKANNDYLPRDPDDPTSEDQFYIDIEGDYNQGIVRVTVSNDYQLDFTKSDFNYLLGFTKKIVTVTENSTLPVDINRGVQSLYVHCDMTNSSVVGSSTSGDVILEFTFAFTGPSSLCDLTQIVPQPFDLKADVINSVRIWISDQRGRPVDFNGEDFTIQLLVREKPGYKLQKIIEALEKQQALSRR